MTGPYSQGGFPEDQGPVYGAPNPYGYQQPLPPPSMYGFGDPYAPYGRHPVTGEPYSDKSKATAGLLQILLGFFGICGVGRLYIGSVGIGLCQLLGMFLRAVHVGVPHRNSICDRNLDLGVRRRHRDTFGQCAGRCSPAIARMSREREPRKHVWGTGLEKVEPSRSPITKAITYRRRIEGKYVA